MHSQTNRPRTLRPFLPLVIALVAGAATAFTWKDENDYYYKVNRNLEIFGQVYREVSQSYVDRIDPENFIGAGIEAMLHTLDPYTVYQRGDANDVDLLTTGSYGGIGITVGMRDGMVTVTDVIDGYSAQQEGVRIGDRLQKINNADVLNGPVEALREHTRGDVGTSLTITLLRDGAPRPLMFRLTRENVKLRSVAFSKMLPGGIGYLRLERFSANAGDEVRTAILELRKSGELRGLLLDLRDNPGGLLDAAVDVTSNFVPTGSIVVSTRGRDSAENRVYRSKDQPAAQGLPLVVLVNGNSASAAEIVAGAVQDLDAGVIMGTQSFGKGLVQSVRRLPYDASMKITTARYYTPLGRSIQKVDYARQRTSKSASTPPPAAFRTARGRTLYDHGGIMPDSMLSETDLPAALEQLRSASIFFKFATRYAATLEHLPDNFVVTDELVRRFEGFALDTEQTAGLDSSTATLLGRLRAAAVREGAGKDVIGGIDELRTAWDANQRRLMGEYREAIRQELYHEITARFRGQRERRNALADTDRQVLAAQALLRNGRASYSRLLGSR